MKKTFIAVAFLFFTACPAVLFANEASDLPQNFMKLVMEGKVSDAIDQYFGTNPMASERTQQLQMVKNQIDGAVKIYGAPYSLEVIAVDDLSPSLRRFVYITEHESIPLTWEFYVYKPKDVWIAVTMNFNDNFSLTAPRK